MFDRLKKKMGLGRQTYPVHFAAMPQTAEVHEPDHRALADFARRGPGVRIIRTPSEALPPPTLPPLRPISVMEADRMIPPQRPLPDIPIQARPPSRPVPTPPRESFDATPAPPRPIRTRRAAKKPKLSIVAEGVEPLQVDSRALQNAALLYTSQVLQHMVASLNKAAENIAAESDDDSPTAHDFDFGFGDGRPESGVIDLSYTPCHTPTSSVRRARLPQDRVGRTK